MKKEFLAFIFILIISIGLVFDLFINQGQPVTFDGPTHITNIAMFYKSLKEGNIRVTWTDGFANYGMPLGLMAQQTTSYLGAIINFLANNPLLSFNLVFLIGAFLSNLSLYWLLRHFFSQQVSVAAVFLFNLAPYRIINIYIRGALPEFFASIFLPLLLIGIKKFIETKKFSFFALISLSFAFLILTHPFMLIIYGFLVLIFTVIFLNKRKTKKITVWQLLLSFFVGLLLSFYFIFPLSAELRYFYYGRSLNHFNEGHFLSWENLLDPRWFYFYKNDIAPRGHFMKTGVFETFLGIFYAVLLLKKGFDKKNYLLEKTALFSFFIYLFFLTPLSGFIYKNFPLLGNIQHPWRMLSGFIFLPPVFLGLLLERIKKPKLRLTFIYSLLIIISLLRLPQLYGKNYQLIDQKSYFFTKENLHGVILNTVWTDKTENYPIKKNKAEIIEGKGRLVTKKIKNNYRQYQVSAETPVRLVDYTFYFPGWRAYDNGKRIPIEFQDPNYRGIITYRIDRGNHKILLKFEETPVRLLGIIGSLSGVFFLIFLYGKRKNYFTN